jgi:hypothetical protein
MQMVQEQEILTLKILDGRNNGLAVGKEIQSFF